MNIKTYFNICIYLTLTCRDNAKLLPTESVSLIVLSSSELFVMLTDRGSSGKLRSALIKLILLLSCSLGVWLV